MVTMQKIAELCGVSRGTVDRVMHGRGRVSPETAENIRRVAKELGYKPNPAGKALAARKKQPVVSVILSSEGNPFFDEIIRGLRTGAELYSVYGLEMKLYTMKGYDVQQQLRLIQQVRQESDALIINPIDDEAVRNLLNELVADGCFVVTINNDIQPSNRQCFVGSDFVNGGVTACALLAAFTYNHAKVGIVIGSRQMAGHRKRLAGFQYRMRGMKDFQLLATVENQDDEICSFNKTKEMLQEHPEITAVYLAAGGVYGACRAIMELPEEKRPLVIAVDSVPSTVEMMEKGIIKAVIYQHPYRQGRRAMELAFDYVVNGREPRESTHIMKNEIKLLENL